MPPTSPSRSSWPPSAMSCTPLLNGILGMVQLLWELTPRTSSASTCPPSVQTSFWRSSAHLGFHTKLESGKLVPGARLALRVCVHGYPVTCKPPQSGPAPGNRADVPARIMASRTWCSSSEIFWAPSQVHRAAKCI